MWGDKLSFNAKEAVDTLEKAIQDLGKAVFSSFEINKSFPSDSPGGWRYIHGASRIGQLELDVRALNQKLDALATQMKMLIVHVPMQVTEAHYEVRPLESFRKKGGKSSHA